MGRRHGNRDAPPASWESERTLAAAEEEERAPPLGDTRCACGSGQFLLEAFMSVKDGVIAALPVEVESLTCPQCGREYEAVPGEGGRILRGDYLGQVDADQE